MKNPLSGITDRIPHVNRQQFEKAAKVTAGTAAAIWVVLKLRRELYGPGGTKLSRYDRAVDEVWEERRARERSAR
ncbi:MAG TPA: hypothetical protein VKO87_08880 [Gemmatimonadaceae bacterium]|jgi:hypothetical protein|nr:hypothetical protein [Gemmatimonadaceae bacterium]HXV16345.1 hypothetical protein [Gemmatimonadaceae bacterium]